jgi:hypothetical protein
MAQLLGNFGEFAGAIAVVITLGYLAVQVSQNTKASRASTYSETTDGWTHYLLAQSVEDLDLLVGLASDPKQLSTAKFYRAYYLCRALFRRMEHDYYQYKAGTFEKETWNAYATSFEQDTFNNPGIRVMWKLQRDYLDPDFVEFTDGVVERSALRGPTHTPRLFEQLLDQERDTAT